MRVYGVSLLIVLLVLAVSLLFGFSGRGKMRHTRTALTRERTTVSPAPVENMPTGLRIELED